MGGVQGVNEKSWVAKLVGISGSWRSSPSRLSMQGWVHRSVHHHAMTYREFYDHACRKVIIIPMRLSIHSASRSSPRSPISIAPIARPQTKASNPASSLFPDLTSSQAKISFLLPLFLLLNYPLQGRCTPGRLTPFTP